MSGAGTLVSSDVQEDWAEMSAAEPIPNEVRDTGQTSKYT
jgi:hypothetical protein